MSFEELLQQAQMADGSAFEKIAVMYEPLLCKESKIHGQIDEDLHQDQLVVLLRCIRKFDLTNAIAATIAA
jgi:hypothetical protein